MPTNEILQYLKKHGERMDTDIAEAMTPEKSIRDLVDLASSLDHELASNLSDSFARLVWVLSTDGVSPAKRAKLLAQLNSYLKKKADEFDPILIEENTLNLRKVRNELAHGKLRRDRDFTPLYPTLWKAITRLALKLGPDKIENLLAYSLRVKNMNLSDRGATPAKIVAAYRPIFNTFEPQNKKEIFAELLLRLFSDNESMMMLNIDPRK